MKLHGFLRNNPGWLPASIFMLLLAAMIAPAHSQTPTLTFTVQTTTTDGRTIVPTLTWAMAPTAAGTPCTATGGWSGTKAATGTQTLAAVSATTGYSIRCDWPGDLTALVSWTPPTTNTDGTAYTDPGGARIQYGTAANALNTSAYVTDPAARTWRSPTLTPGPWFFTVRIVNARGLESDPYTPPVSKTIVAAANQSRTLEVTVKFPGVATVLGVE